MTEFNFAAYHSRLSCNLAKYIFTYKQECYINPLFPALRWEGKQIDDNFPNVCASSKIITRKATMFMHRASSVNPFRSHTTAGNVPA